LVTVTKQISKPTQQLLFAAAVVMSHLDDRQLDLLSAVSGLSLLDVGETVYFNGAFCSIWW
jgi:hypothetical protein